ncbi:hypothetical protein Bca101_010439 [Brassica carinata]
MKIRRRTEDLPGRASTGREEPNRGRGTRLSFSRVPVLTCRIPELDWSLARNGEVVEMRPQVDGVWSRRSTARRRRWSRSHTENSRPGARAQL